MLGKIFQIFNTRWDHIFLSLFFWSDLQSYSNTLAGQSLDTKQVCLHLFIGARYSVDYLVSGVQIVLLLSYYSAHGRNWWWEGSRVDFALASAFLRVSNVDCSWLITRYRVGRNKLFGTSPPPKPSCHVLLSISECRAFCDVLSSRWVWVTVVIWNIIQFMCQKLQQLRSVIDTAQKINAQLSLFLFLNVVFSMLNHSFHCVFHSSDVLLYS